MKHYDIIIQGAGIVGLAAALALAKSKLTILILEQHALPEQPLDLSFYDRRVSAIHRGSQQFFKNLGIWNQLPHERIRTYTKMKVWDAVGRGTIEFDACDLAEPDLGCIIENRLLSDALLSTLKNKANIEMLEKTTVKTVQFNDHAHVTTDQGVEYTTSLLIGADGAQSKIRDLLNIPITVHPLGHQAIVATIQTEKPHENTARQIFTPEGPLAFLPLPNPHQCSIVWSSTHANDLMKLDRGALTQKLEKTFESTLGTLEFLDDPLCFPLVSRHAKEYVRPHAALIGDAIHTIHPLAGQGLNLGLMDAECLSRVVLATHEKSRDIGNFLALRRFERERKGENQITLRAMEGFKQLFSYSNTSFAALRSAGIQALNRCPPLKNHFMRRAMGQKHLMPPP